MIDDINSAVRWTKKNATLYQGDPEKIILAGQSAGGLGYKLNMYRHMLVDTYRCMSVIRDVCVIISVFVFLYSLTSQTTG